MEKKAVIRSTREIPDCEYEETNHDKTNNHLHTSSANPRLLVLVVVVVKGGVGFKKHAFRVSNEKRRIEDACVK